MGARAWGAAHGDRASLCWRWNVLELDSTDGCHIVANVLSAIDVNLGKRECGRGLSELRSHWNSHCCWPGPWGLCLGWAVLPLAGSLLLLRWVSDQRGPFLPGQDLASPPGPQGSSFPTRLGAGECQQVNE